MDVLKQLQWRYATQVFDPTQKIAPKDWRILKESLRLAPSSYGLQPCRYLVIENPELRLALREHAWDQSQVTDASHFIVITVRRDLTEQDVNRALEAIAQTRHVPLDSLDRYRATILKSLAKKSAEERWQSNVRQAYIALGFVLTTAAALQIDACPMEGFKATEFDTLLDLNETPYSSVLCVALGYRQAADKRAKLQKVRFPEQDLFEVK